MDAHLLANTSKTSDTLARSFHKRLSLIVAGSMLALSALTIHIERVVLESDLRDKGEGIARILSAVILDAALSHDYATMERYVRDLARERFLLGISVLRNDGEILAKAGGEKDENAMRIKHPIRLGAEDFATVHVSLSLARVERLTRATMAVVVVLLLATHLAGVFLTNMVLFRTVISPLRQLKAAIGRMSAGSFDERVHMEKPAEFAEIGAAFNEMAARIQQSFDAVEKGRQTLRGEQAKLAAIVDSMADGLFVTDTAGSILSFNGSATRITGYHSEEVLGKSCSEVFRSTLCADACALGKENDTLTNIETSLHDRDGRRLVVAVSSAVLRSDGGEVIGGVQTFRDISEEKKRQELFCRTEKLAAIGELAAGVAHEINTPLGNILGFARLLEREELGLTARRKAEVIVEQTKKCSAIVQGLLDYSRASSSQPEKVDLALLAARVVEVLRFRADRKKIAMSTDFQPAPPLFLDPRKVEQVLFNLIINAIQATPAAGAIELATGADNDHAFFAVHDSGPGILPENRCRIFDPFYTTKPPGEGTGLGLSIAGAIVTEAGGLIDLDNRPGGGSSFVVRLPLAGTREETNERS